MSKKQYAVLSLAGLLFLVLYFGLDTKSKEQKKVEESIVLEATDINSLLLAAKKQLTPENSGDILFAEAKMADAKDEPSKQSEAFKSLSSAWYNAKYYAIAGFYAEKVAEIEATDEAWSIAGSTYNIGMNREQEAKVKTYCQERAIKAFENATSLNPDEIQHRINLAICHVEGPAPMRGIQMLLGLNEKNPDNVSVLLALGRLSLRSNQTEKAVSRLENALELAPQNIKVVCMLAQAYEANGQSGEAANLNQKCQLLSKEEQ